MTNPDSVLKSKEKKKRCSSQEEKQVGFELGMSDSKMYHLLAQLERHPHVTQKIGKLVRLWTPLSALTAEGCVLFQEDPSSVILSF